MLGRKLIIKKVLKLANLKHRVALVTGVCNAVGMEIAKQLASSGAFVVVNFVGSREDVNWLIFEIKTTGGRVIEIQGNPSKDADINRIFSEIEMRLGRIDILINNTDPMSIGPLGDYTEERYRAAFDTNILGTLLSVKKAASQFGPDGGSIINIASPVTHSPHHLALGYGATMAAVTYITKALAIELGPKKIRVNAVLPGMSEAENYSSPRHMQTDISGAGAGGMPPSGPAQHVSCAHLVAFLASDEARWVTGNCLGGRNSLY